MQRDIDDIFEFFTEDEKMDEMNDSVDVASDLSSLFSSVLTVFVKPSLRVTDVTFSI